MRVGSCSRALKFHSEDCTGISIASSSQGSLKRNDYEILAAVLPDDSKAESSAAKQCSHPSPASASDSTGYSEDSSTENSEEFIAMRVWGDTWMAVLPSNNLTQCKATLRDASFVSRSQRPVKPKKVFSP